MIKEKANRKSVSTWCLVSILAIIGFIGVSAFFNIYIYPHFLAEHDIVRHISGDKGEILKEISTSFNDNDELKVIESVNGILIKIIKDDSTVVYSSLSKMDDDEKSIKPVGNKSEGMQSVYLKNTDETYIVYDYQKDENLKEDFITELNFPKGYAVKIYFDTRIYKTIIVESAIQRAIANSILVIAIWIFFTIIISEYSTKIKKLNLAVKKVKAPDFSGRCPENSSEVGRLGKNINVLLNDAENQVKALKKDNEILKEKLESEISKEDEKKDFLANTAHEMKTPISIIQGYAEGLKLGIAKGGRARQKYCDIIIDETNKMNDLVLELLELSKYKQKMYEDVKEENFSIRSFVQGNLNSMDPIFKENSIEIVNTINRKFIGRTDIEKQNLVLRNYLKNAISHINMYKKIVISCEERTNAYRISVYNTGNRIPEENLKRIWDSFYRVDKSHERSEGRFGIGLSIVASIQKALGMDYGVENVYGGVQFWFDVKKATKEDK